MSVLPHGMAPAEPPPPRASALGIVVRRGPTGLEVLLGRRARASRFLPGHLAFPGGVRERQDGEGEDGWRRCASRELLEETGLRIAPDQWLDVGERITPPLFPVRFRTRFFLAEVAATTAAPSAASPEMDEVAFRAPAPVLEAWASGAALVPPPVLPLLRALAEAAGPLEVLAGTLAGVNAGERAAPRIEFLPDVWMLPLRTRTLPPATHTNAWMPGGRAFVVLDPGTDDPGELASLARVVDRRRAGGAELRAIVLTHGHPDHALGAAAAAALLGVEIRAHAHVLRSLGLQGTPLREGDVLELSGLRLVVLETPGHAPGHLAFHAAERGFALVGDLLSSLSTILVDPDEGDMEAFLASLGRVRDLRCRTLLPAHGAPVPGGAAEETLAHRHAREARLLEALAGGARTLPALADAAYADTPAAPRPLRERQTLAHLLALARAGRVSRQGDGWLRHH